MTGVDLNHRSLLQARENVKIPFHLVQSDIERLPFLNESFDLVLCIGVLSYLNEDHKAISEIARVVKNKGVIVVASPNFYMINKFFDPFYLIIWPLKKFIKIFIKSPNQKKVQIIRRYNFIKLNKKLKNQNLGKIANYNVSFGPFLFFRKELLPVKTSIKLSEQLSRIGNKKYFKFLCFFSNHWVLCLKKEPSNIEE